MTFHDMVDELMYRSYAHNRALAPMVSAERWEAVYGSQARSMEVRYQREMTKQ